MLITPSSRPFQLRRIRGAHQETVNREVLRGDHANVFYFKAEVGNFIQLEVYIPPEENPSFTS